MIFPESGMLRFVCPSPPGMVALWPFERPWPRMLPTVTVHNEPTPARLPRAVAPVVLGIGLSRVLIPWIFWIFDRYSCAN